MQSPFLLQNTRLYDKWRTQKLILAEKFMQQSNSKFFISIKNTQSLSDFEISQITERCNDNSMCLYQLNNQSQNNKKCIHTLASQLGLKTLLSNICADIDKLTSITHKPNNDKHIYIPYTQKQLSWHTDGYYNTPDKQINSMLLHCSQPALRGGETFLMDHEIVYLLLRNKNPRFIEALMQDDVMTIPANIINDKEVRAAQTGPVFSINKLGQLHMRYTARKRNIEWKQSTLILEAVEFINELLDSNSEYISRHTLQAGEGLICRNVLHCRTSFVDFEDPDKKRLLYRGRYSDNLQ